MKLLRDRIFASVSLSHLMVEVINGLRAILLAYLSVPLGLTNTSIGAISMVYQFASALAQPVFGFLADRIGPRWIVAGGVLWMGLFYSLGLTIPGAVALVFIVIASTGSGMFHPAGAMQATVQGRNYMAGRETTAASYFFVFGQFGFFLGPLIGGRLLAHWGPLALLPIILLTVPVGAMGAWYLRTVKPAPVRRAKGSAKPAVPVQVWMLVALALIAMFQSMAQQTVNAFVPKYMVDLGQSASKYGFYAACFMGGSGIGNVLGGTLADRFGKKRVISISMCLGSIPLFFIGRVGVSAGLLLMVILTGIFNGAAYSVIVVLAQKTLPVGMGLASGLILGFNFGSGSLGMLFGGMLADSVGFQPVFMAAASVALLGGLLALTLKPEKPPIIQAIPLEIQGD